MGVSRSSCYEKQAETRRKAKAREDARIQAEVEQIHMDMPATGYRPMLEYLRRRNIPVGERRLRRIMRETGLQALVKRAWMKTTQSDHSRPIYRNLLPEMGVDGLNQVWVADITYIRITSCFIYLAVILDIYSRKVIGWALSRRLDTELTLAALQMAIQKRRPRPGCIHHSDRGIQYLCKEYVQELQDNGFHISNSAKGNPYENAFAESFMKTLKTNEIHLWDYETFEDVKERVPEFLEQVYNRKRLHSALHYLSPNEFEKKWCSNKTKKSEAARPVLIL